MLRSSQGGETRLITLSQLVLLPGLHGTLPLFEPLLDCLPPQWPVRVIEYPGDQRLGYDDLLTLIRDRLPRGEPFILLGESFSGPLAIRLAAQHPPELRGVILVGTFVRKPVRWMPAWTGPLAPSFLFRGMPLWMAFRLLALGRSTPDLRRLFRDALADVQPSVLAHRLREALRVDVADKFQAVGVPVLAIAGRFDHTVPAHNLEALRRLRPDLKVEMIDTDHLILQLEPARAAEVIERFVASVGNL